MWVSLVLFGFQLELNCCSVVCQSNIHMSGPPVKTVIAARGGSLTAKRMWFMKITEIIGNHRSPSFPRECRGPIFRRFDAVCGCGKSDCLQGRWKIFSIIAQDMFSGMASELRAWSRILTNISKRIFFTTNFRYFWNFQIQNKLIYFSLELISAERKFFLWPRQIICGKLVRGTPDAW